MLKATLNSSLWLIRTKNLYSDGDELSVVYCIQKKKAIHYDRRIKITKTTGFSKKNETALGPHVYQKGPPNRGGVGHAGVG